MADRAAYTLKDYFFQLVTITAGVLIALAVDSLVEWRDEQALVEQARATIRQEIQDNHKDLAAELGGVDARRGDLQNALRLADDLLVTGKSTVHSVKLEMTLASLDSTGWHTAERTGALGYMDYVEVKKYAEVYALQDLFVSQQQRAMQGLTGALAIIALGDPYKAKARDLESFRTHVLETIAELKTEELLGVQLLKGYEKALQP
jgi:hypothetical protein